MPSATRVKAGLRAVVAQVALSAWLAGLSAGAAAVELHYEAYVSGVKIGTATVTILRAGNHYEIRGSASARGVAALFSDWQSDFYAAGTIENGSPSLSSYGYEETERRKHRILILHDGRMEVIKNGRPRSATPAPDGLDVLSAFFIAPACWSDRYLHTGRSSYLLAGKRSSSGGCSYLVADEDGDRTRVYMTFSEVGNRLVPSSLRTGGLLSGRILLKTVDEAPFPPQLAAASPLGDTAAGPPDR
jgi:hypothetical protein